MSTKHKKHVGLVGKLHGLVPQLNVDLPLSGYSPFTLDGPDRAHPFGTVAVIYSGESELTELASVIESLQDDRVQLIFVSVDDTNHPEGLLTDYGHLKLRAEHLVRESGLPFTIVRAMGAQDRPAHHHHLFWKQDLEGPQNGHEHPVTWGDLSQVLVHCVSRPEVLNKTFTVHSIAGEPVENWHHWFKGMQSDSGARHPL